MEKRERMEEINKREFKIVQWNIDGINNKKTELEQLMVEWRADVVLIQETKLRDKQKTPIFNGYTSVRKDRKYMLKDNDRKGGGLLTLIKKEVPFRRKRGWKGTTTEGLRVKVWLNNNEPLNITQVYRPPIRKIKGEDEREQDEVRKWLRSERNGVIAGDLNLHHKKWSRGKNRGREANELLNWCEERKYMILNNGADTYLDRAGRGGSSPDLTIVAENLNSKCKWEVMEQQGSDHCPIVTTVEVERKGKKKKVRSNWAWKKS